MKPGTEELDSGLESVLLITLAYLSTHPIGFTGAVCRKRTLNQTALNSIECGEKVGMHAEGLGFCPSDWDTIGTFRHGVLDAVVFVSFRRF